MEQSFAYSFNEVADIASELEAFRHQWLLELKQPETEETDGPSFNCLQSPTKEEEARFLYLRGVHAEDDGRLSIATQYYRRAMQIEPNIEAKFNGYNSDDSTVDGDNSDMSDSDSSSEEYDENSDLLTYFSRLQLGQSTKFIPETEQKATHLSSMPTEVLIYILRWIVSQSLDIETLEKLSMVCRGFYICARDETLWKLICIRVFGKIGNYPLKFNSYRNMYLETPHLRFSGCYISRSTYFRPGEKSLETYSHPFHLVEYYRYIRFFPNGNVLMLTSPDEPSSVVPRLKNQNAYLPGILNGYFSLENNIVTMVMKRISAKPPNTLPKRRLRPNPTNDIEQTFIGSLMIRDSGKRISSQLNWLQYSVHSLYRNTGEKMIAEFELRPTSYPSLFFSIVKSYVNSSEVPL